MNEIHLMGWIAGLMQFAVAGYALRLNRRFGTARVGWSLFGAFSLLALIQLIQSTAAFGVGSDSRLEVSVAYVLISFLLLLGMIHLETMLKERLQVERIEIQLRAELELEVKSKTAHLHRAIEELVSEMDETKRMAAIIESAGTTMIASRAGSMAVSVRRPNGDGAQILGGVLGGEWIAHF